MDSATPKPNALDAAKTREPLDEIDIDGKTGAGHALEEPPTQKPSDVLDANADINEESLKNRPWYTRLYLVWPVVYIPYFILLLGFGVVTIVFGVKARHELSGHHDHDDVSGSNETSTSSPGSSNRSLFWSFLSIFMAFVAGICITYEIQSIVLSAFWKRRARAFIQAGAFAGVVQSKDKDKKNETPIVLEIGPHGGVVSARFAREIMREYATNRTSLSIPIFVGYGNWLRWFRLPNNPRCFLQTLFDVGVPRDHILANRCEHANSSGDQRARLPYADNSVSLIVCNMGMADICKWLNTSQKRVMMRELARVLKVGGKMIVIQNHTADLNVKKSLFSWPPGGAMASYKRVLVEELGWPDANVKAKAKDNDNNSAGADSGAGSGSKGGAKTGWAWGLINYLEATKPRTEVKSV